MCIMGGGRFVDFTLFLEYPVKMKQSLKRKGRGVKRTPIKALDMPGVGF